EVQVVPSVRPEGGKEQRHVIIRGARLQPAAEGDHVVVLSRATYKLPKAKAEPLAAFLREHVKAAVLETKVEGDSLIITTTPESQKAIGGLIALIQGKSSAALDLKPALKEEVELKLDGHTGKALNLLESAHPHVMELKLDRGEFVPKSLDGLKLDI